MPGLCGARRKRQGAQQSSAAPTSAGECGKCNADNHNTPPKSNTAHVDTLIEGFQARSEAGGGGASERGVCDLVPALCAASYLSIPQRRLPCSRALTWAPPSCCFPKRFPQQVSLASLAASSGTMPGTPVRTHPSSEVRCLYPHLALCSATWPCGSYGEAVSCGRGTSVASSHTARGSPHAYRPAPSLQGYLTFKKTHPPRTPP